MYYPQRGKHLRQSNKSIGVLGIKNKKHRTHIDALLGTVLFMNGFRDILALSY